MYEINLDDSAKKFLKSLDISFKTRIIKKIEQLKVNPMLGKPLCGNLKGHFKLRCGKYRAIYKIINGKLIIVVIKIGHRKNVYI